MDQDKVFHVEIYGDDELLATSDSINSYMEPMTLEADITGHSLIKIVAVREDHNLSICTAQPSLAVVSAAFSNTEIPEFQCYEE